MENTVKSPISVKLITEIRDGKQLETVTVRGEGQQYVKDGSTFLSFIEKQEAENEDVNTIVKIDDKKVLVLRKGAVSMRQVFEKGKTTAGSYKHPFGDMQMETTTEYIRYQEHEATPEGKLELAYKMKMQGQPLRRHRMTIMFESQG